MYTRTRTQSGKKKHFYGYENDSQVLNSAGIFLGEYSMGTTAFSGEGAAWNN